jgi:hypothetical protein
VIGRICHDEHRAGRGIALGLGLANGWQYCANRQNSGQQKMLGPSHIKLLKF